jgi:hypothetical protein
MTPLQVNVHVRNPSVELRLVMSAAAHAIADPCRQHLAAGDALSRQFVGRRLLGLADTWTFSTGLPRGPTVITGLSSCLRSA